MKRKVVIAASGGVDSSTAAALLKQQGYDCQAVYLNLYPQPKHKAQEAAEAAEQLKIPFEILDLSGDFSQVIDYFLNEYKAARTPNPCVLCNRKIKFGKLFEYAMSKGADFLATGHYARVVSGGLYAANSEKDQSYALAMLNKNVLPNILFPLGELEKSQTRKIAAQLGLAVHSKSDSQEICFIPDDDYAGLLAKLCPQLIKQGNIVDTSGKILGSHNGIHNFTIGQRRGLKVAMGQPYYVIALNAENNTVVLGTNKELEHTALIADAVNWLINEPNEKFEALVKIRYNQKPVSGTVLPQGEKVKIIFDKPVRAITPGQAAVIYIKTGAGLRAAGGGWIKEAID